MALPAAYRQPASKKSLRCNFIGLNWLGYSDKKIHYSASRNSFVGLIGTLMRNWSRSSNKILKLNQPELNFQLKSASFHKKNQTF